MRPSSVIVGVPAYERLVHGYALWPSKPATVLGQPLLALGEVRHDALERRPELFIVTRLAQVHQLVSQDVVDVGWWEENSAPVHVHAPPARAPPVSEVAHLHG